MNARLESAGWPLIVEPGKACALIAIGEPGAVVAAGQQWIATNEVSPRRGNTAKHSKQNRSQAQPRVKSTQVESKNETRDKSCSISKNYISSRECLTIKYAV